MIWFIWLSAHDVGIKGTKIVLETDGSEVCDDEVLAHYIEEKNIFILLENHQIWTQQLNISASFFNETFSADKSLTQPLEINEFIITPHDNQEVAPQRIEEEHSEIIISAPNSAAHEDTDTLSMSSTAMTNTSSANSICVMLFSNFIIPWNKFPSDITTMFQNKLYLGKRMNCLGNILIDEMRQISFFIPMSIIRTVAHRVASRYPDSFYLKDNEQVIITTIPVALITIMKNRNSFLNRPPKRVREELIANIPAKQRKTANVLKNTCVNWQPANIGSGETCSSIESKSKYLQDLFKQNKISAEERETAKKFMKDCFAVQRVFLNDRSSIPDVQQIQEKCPFLFEKEFAFQHFEQLMAIDPVKIKNEFEQKQEIVKRFWSESKQKNIYACIKGSNMNNSCNLIKCFFLYFNEDSSFLFKQFEV